MHILKLRLQKEVCIIVLNEHLMCTVYHILKVYLKKKKLCIYYIFKELKGQLSVLKERTLSWHTFFKSAFCNKIILSNVML